MLGSAVVEIGGLEVPDAGPVFLTALAFHIAAGSTAVVAGAVTALSRKRAGRHPRAGRVFLSGVAVVFVTATVMAVIRWEHNAHLFAVAVVTFGLATTGLWVRRRRPRRWRAWHGAAMSGAYVALLTGFYVDNGPQLPLWDRLPPVTFWFLPAAVGIPLTWWALRRNHAIGRPRAGPSRRSTPVGSGR
jgi:hypothetical protein